MFKKKKFGLFGRNTANKTKQEENNKRTYSTDDILMNSELSDNEYYHVLCMDEHWRNKIARDVVYLRKQPGLIDQVRNEYIGCIEAWENINSGQYYRDKKFRFTSKETKEIIDDKAKFCLKVIGPDLFLSKYEQLKTKNIITIKDSIYEYVYYIFWPLIIELSLYVFEHDRGKFLLEYIASGGGPELEIDPDCQKLAQEILEKEKKR